MANAVTLLRSNLATVLPNDPHVLAAAALASDLLDGRLARRSGTVTPFGRYADSLADAAFWTWFALRHEPDRRLRVLALVAWIFLVVAVMVISMARGSMIDAPRPAVARPAAVMLILLAARALGRSQTKRHAGARAPA